MDRESVQKALREISYRREETNIAAGIEKMHKVLSRSNHPQPPWSSMLHAETSIWLQPQFCSDLNLFLQPDFPVCHIIDNFLKMHVVIVNYYVCNYCKRLSKNLLIQNHNEELIVE